MTLASETSERRRKRALWRRVAASIVDVVIFLLITVACYPGQAGSNFKWLVWAGLQLLVLLLIAPVAVRRFGTTPGKRVFGLQVVDGRGSRIGAVAAALRSAAPLCFVGTSVLYGVAYAAFGGDIAQLAAMLNASAALMLGLWFGADCLVMFVRRDGRALHDLMSGSYVCDLPSSKGDGLNDNKLQGDGGTSTSERISDDNDARTGTP